MRYDKAMPSIKVIFYTRILFASGLMALGLAVHVLNLFVLPLPLLFCWQAAYCGYALFSLLTSKKQSEIPPLLGMCELLVDVIFMSFFFGATGGDMNPLTALYLIPVMFASLMLPTLAAWSVFILTTFAYYFISTLHLPLQVPSTSGLSYMQIHNYGMILGFVLASLLVLVMMVRLARSLRQRDLELKEAESLLTVEAHFAKMGVVAANAAHELNTPLSTLGMINRELSLISNSSDMSALLEQSQRQLEKSKQALTKILKVFAISHTKSVEACSLTDYLSTLKSESQARYPDHHIEFVHDCGDFQLYPDPYLTDILTNLIDNSSKVSLKITLKVLKNRAHLIFEIADEGGGLAKDKISQLKRPLEIQIQDYFQNSQDPHGLGLILVQFFTKRLNGMLEFHEHEPISKISLSIPLERLAA